MKPAPVKVRCLMPVGPRETLRSVTWWRVGDNHPQPTRRLAVAFLRSASEVTSTQTPKMRTSHFEGMLYTAPDDSRLNGAPYVSPFEDVAGQSIADFWPCDDDGNAIGIYPVPLPVSTVRKAPAGRLGFESAF